MCSAPLSWLVRACEHGPHAKCNGRGGRHIFETRRTQSTAPDGCTYFIRMSGTKAPSTPPLRVFVYGNEAMSRGVAEVLGSSSGRQPHDFIGADWDLQWLLYAGMAPFVEHFNGALHPTTMTTLCDGQSVYCNGNGLASYRFWYPHSGSNPRLADLLALPADLLVSRSGPIVDRRATTSPALRTTSAAGRRGVGPPRCRRRWRRSRGEPWLAGHGHVVCRAGCIRCVLFIAGSCPG